MNMIELAKKVGFTVTGSRIESPYIGGSDISHRLAEFAALVRAEYEATLRLAEEALDMARKGIPPGSGMYGEALAAIREVLADHSGDANEMVAEHKCGGCAKTAADGWALYCVECWEKAEPVSNERLLEAAGYIKKADPVKHSEHYWLHEINNARADGYERGYMAAKKLYAEPVKQEPVFWVHPMDFGRECGVTPKQESDELIPLYAAPVQPMKQEPVAFIENGIFKFNIPSVHSSVEKGLLTGKHELYAAPVDAKAIGLAIHYPDCWDTAAYPTLDSALAEVAASGKPFRCTNDDCVDAKAIRAEAYQQGRDDMKEEAAKVCDDMAKLLHKHFKGAQAEEATTCAAAIRGLK